MDRRVDRSEYGAWGEVVGWIARGWLATTWSNEQQTNETREREIKAQRWMEGNITEMEVKTNGGRNRWRWRQMRAKMQGFIREREADGWVDVFLSIPEQTGETNELMMDLWLSPVEKILYCKFAVGINQLTKWTSCSVRCRFQLKQLKQLMDHLHSLSILVLFVQKLSVRFWMGHWNRIFWSVQQ